MINARVVLFKIHSESLKEATNNQSRKEKLIKALSYLNKNRGISRKKFMRFFQSTKDLKTDAEVFKLLGDLGIVRHRVEITKYGKEFLRSIK